MVKALNTVIPGNRQRLATKNQFQMALAAAEGAGKGLTKSPGLAAHTGSVVQWYTCTESWPAVVLEQTAGQNISKTISGQNISKFFHF